MNKKFLIILSAGFVIILSVIGWMAWKGYQLQKAEVLVITDKTEYERGETLRVKIKNNLEEAICFSSCYPYYLQRKNKKWESYKYVECYDFNGNGHCIDAEKEKFFELTLPKTPDGLHRLAIPVCAGCKDAKDFKEDKRFYSNEFWIREKGEANCDEECKQLGYISGYCARLPIPGQEEYYQEGEIGLGTTIDCSGTVDKWACCCKK